MIWLAALVVVLASFAVLGVARLANPADPVDVLLREEPPWACSCCGRSWQSKTAWITHSCDCWNVR